MNSYLSAGLLSLFYCLAVFFLAYFFIQKKIRINTHILASLGAGALVSLILLDFLPHSLESSSSLPLLIVFVSLGFLVNMLAEVYILPRISFFDRLIRTKEEEEKCSGGKHGEHGEKEHAHHHVLSSRAGCSIMPCFILCAFFDGLRLNSAVLIGPDTAVLAGIGLLFHLLPESLTLVGIGLASRFSKKSLFIITAVFCLSFLAGSFSFMPMLQTEGGFIFSFSTGLFIYVSSVHLIPMVINWKTKIWFFAGFSVLSLIFMGLRFFSPLGH